MKSNYFSRAMRSRDPRFAKIAEKLTYSRRDMQAAPISPAPTFDDLADARAEYESVLQKKPFHGWDVATLREKISAAKVMPTPEPVTAPEPSDDTEGGE